MLFIPLLKGRAYRDSTTAGRTIRRSSPVRPPKRLLRHETLEQRRVLSTVSGTVFEDLDGNGVRDPGELGLEDWTVVLDRAETADLLETFVSPMPEEGEKFGNAVAAVGNNVLVGAYQNDTGAEDAGAAYLLDGSTGQLLQTFLNPTPDAGDWFGRAVAAIGDKVLVGASRDDAGAEDAGAAYLFNASTGQLLRTFLNPTPTAYDNFGHGLAAFGDNVLIAAAGTGRGGADNVGVVYLFDRNTGQLLRTFENPTPDANDYFGAGPHSIAAVGGNVLIGANLDDTAGEDVGAAYLFGSSGF